MSAQPIESQRRRLTKKAAPPVSHIDTSVSAADRASDPHTLRRSPSLPIRNRYSAALVSARHNRSPTLPSPSGGSTNTSVDITRPAHTVAGAQQRQYHPRYSVTEKSSIDLLGQRFDSAAVLHNLAAVPYSAEPLPTLTPTLSHDVYRQSPDSTHSRRSQSHLAPADPSVRLSQSLAATGRKMEDITTSRGELSSLRNPRQRYSDEAVKESKVLKKKSGFSSFFNLSSPRRPAISAPENPVHVTHVGYDQETGEFTVRHNLSFVDDREDVVCACQLCVRSDRTACVDFTCLSFIIMTHLLHQFESSWRLNERLEMLPDQCD